MQDAFFAGRNPLSLYSPPRACPAGAGGPGLRLPKTVDRARRNLKPTSRPIFESGRSSLNPFLDACHAIALQPNLQRSASHSLVGWSTLRPRLTRHPASPRPHAANEENAALRKAIEDADYECGVGLLRLNQLDLVTVVASPATVRRSATVPSPGATHLAIWTSSMRSPLPYRSRRGATVLSALSVDNDSARPWTTTRWR